MLPENELSKQAGVRLDSVTGGPSVDDRLETSVPGVFACGNVLHVHDLVDYVSEEAARAGEQAAAYVQTGERKQTAAAALEGKGGVRYTVPQTLHIADMADRVTVRFRVADVYRDKQLVVYYDGREVRRIKKRILAPGEMEELVLMKSSFADWPDVQTITIALEDQHGDA